MCHYDAIRPPVFGGWRAVPLPDETVTGLASAATRAYLENATAVALGCIAAHPMPVGSPNVTKACSQVQLRQDKAVIRHMLVLWQMSALSTF